MFWNHFAVRSIVGLTLLFSVLALVGIGILIQSKDYIFVNSMNKGQESEQVVPFPVSVNLLTKIIQPNPAVEQFYTGTLALNPSAKNHWWNQVAAVFSSKAWFQNLASPVSRIIVIWPGERKEEVAKNIGDILGWGKAERESFEQLVDSSIPVLAEGKYYPGQYVTHKSATPADIQQLLAEEFQTEVLERYTPEVAAQVPLEDALIIASLLEREASDFENMREVSGVIWNRLFIDMPLQLDATLQYVKGSNLNEKKWWPVVKPSDKYLKSPYNTYKNKGLPPTPIANLSAESILAALNPVVTDCLYYFHSKGGDYYCSENYEDHVSKLRTVYGTGS